jgi:hypothetical protein
MPECRRFVKTDFNAARRSECRENREQRTEQNPLSSLREIVNWWEGRKGPKEIDAKRRDSKPQDNFLVSRANLM